MGRDCLVASDSAVVSVFVACPGAKGCIIVVVWLDGAAAIGAVDVAGAGDVGVLLVDDDDVLGVVLVDEDVVVLVEGTVEVTGAAPITVDEATGVNIVRRALEEPIRRIVENAGLEGSVVVEKVKTATKVTQGFNAESNEYVDMLEAGIIDPTKVERVALQNAASIASLLLTTEALITDLPEKEKAAPPMPHGGDF